jgi:hypothetical protein
MVELPELSTQAAPGVIATETGEGPTRNPVTGPRVGETGVGPPKTAPAQIATATTSAARAAAVQDVGEELGGAEHCGAAGLLLVGHLPPVLGAQATGGQDATATVGVVEGLPAEPCHGLGFDGRLRLADRAARANSSTR